MLLGNTRVTKQHEGYQATSYQATRDSNLSQNGTCTQTTAIQNHKQLCTSAKILFCL